MKKSTLIIGAFLAIISLTAFTLININTVTTEPVKSNSSNKALCGGEPELDLFYGVSSKFMNTITKQDLLTAKTIDDLIPNHIDEEEVRVYHEVKVAKLYNDEEEVRIGKDEILTKKQLAILKTLDYSDNFYIRADYTIKNKDKGCSKLNYFHYYMTIKPEQEASYVHGTDGLIDYLKASTKEATKVMTQDGVRPGKVDFTVSKSGGITNVRLNSTSGYPSVDEVLLQAVKNMSGSWTPATNNKGKNVDQEFMFSFGKGGC